MVTQLTTFVCFYYYNNKKTLKMAAIATKTLVRI